MIFFYQSQEHQKLRGGGTVCQQTKVSDVYGSLVNSVENCKKSKINQDFRTNEIEASMIFKDED